VAGPDPVAVSPTPVPEGDTPPVVPTEPPPSERDAPAAVAGAAAPGQPVEDATRASSDGSLAEPDAGAEAPASEAPPSPVFRLVEVLSVTFDLPSPSPIIHLQEEEAPHRVLYFPIGLPEAQSIAQALEGTEAPRPNAHDLLHQLLDATASDVIAVRLVGAKEGTIIAELDVMTPRGREVLDCRPTDGLAVALRRAVPPPLLVEDSLLDG